MIQNKTHILYPGCLASIRFPEYEAAALSILDKAGIETAPHPLQVCCSSSVCDGFDEDFGFLPVMIMAAAEGKTIVTLCGSCTHTLARAAAGIRDQGVNPEQKLKLASAGYQDFVLPEILHISELIWTNLARFDLLAKRRLNGQAIIISPCQTEAAAKLLKKNLPKPLEMLTEIINMTGLKAISYSGQNDCCGASLSMVDPLVAKEIALAKLDRLPQDAFIIDACANCRTAVLRALSGPPGPRVLFLPEMIAKVIDDDNR